MRKLALLVAIALVVVTAGCIRSLQPFYTDDDLIFAPELVGTWVDENEDQSWTFYKEGDKRYELVYVDRDKRSGIFEARLVKLDDHMFLDFFPKDADLKQNDFYKIHLLPIHTFAYVPQIEPTLHIRFPDPDWLEKHLKDHPDAIDHQELEDDTLLTASTKDLQEFWVKHLDTEGAYAEAGVLTRKEKAATAEDQGDTNGSNG